tara:strand:- start:613 stop:1122 length:510 start_codon:yes stop_codon:yes gene_type:complete
MKKIKNFIFDVDGVLTDGKFYYTDQGKIMKIFGDADNDALSILSKYCHVEMVTGDKRGFDISKKRVEEDMGYKISLVSTFDRLKWISKRFDLEQTVYMGDGIFDPLVFKGVNYSVCPNNGFYNTKKYADYVTKSNGAEGAVAEAILHVLDKFFKVDNILNLKIIKSGNW